MHLTDNFQSVIGLDIGYCTKLKLSRISNIFPNIILHPELTFKDKEVPLLMPPVAPETLPYSFKQYIFKLAAFICSLFFSDRRQFLTKNILVYQHDMKKNYFVTN